MGLNIVATHLLGLGPLVPGQELVGNTALDGAAEPIDTVVGYLGREALQGLENIFVLLDDQVIGAVRRDKKPVSDNVLQFSIAVCRMW